MKYKTELWIHNLTGDVMTVERNACGCHPDDYLLIWGNRYRDCGSYCGIKLRKIRKHIRSRGYELWGHL